ncbi:MAG: ABC transporter substrate-binding protein, partial [Pseudomonadales bacterium]
SLIVTVGTNAARYAYKNFKKHSIVSTLITYDGFQHNVAEVFGSEKAALNAGVSAVLLEQPVKRYFELGTTLVPEAKKVGVLLGPSSLRYEAEIEVIADAFDVKVELVKLKRSDNPIQGIQPVLKQADYFIVLPDQQGFNRSVAKWVLQLSYRHRVPVIGYSKRYAEAGAIASVFSSADDIARETSRLLLLKINDPAAPNAAHQAEEFSVQMNRSVAKAIGITLPVAAKNPAGNGPQRYEAAVQ